MSECEYCHEDYCTFWILFPDCSCAKAKGERPLQVCTANEKDLVYEDYEEEGK